MQTGAPKQRLCTFGARVVGEAPILICTLGSFQSTPRLFWSLASSIRRRLSSLSLAEVFSSAATSAARLLTCSATARPSEPAKSKERRFCRVQEASRSPSTRSLWSKDPVLRAAAGGVLLEGWEEEDRFVSPSEERGGASTSRGLDRTLSAGLCWRESTAALRGSSPKATGRLAGREAEPERDGALSRLPVGGRPDGGRGASKPASGAGEGDPRPCWLTGLAGALGEAACSPLISLPPLSCTPWPLSPSGPLAIRSAAEA